MSGCMQQIKTLHILSGISSKYPYHHMVIWQYFGSLLRTSAAGLIYFWHHSKLTLFFKHWAQTISLPNRFIDLAFKMVASTREENVGHIAHQHYEMNIKLSTFNHNWSTRLLQYYTIDWLIDWFISKVTNKFTLNFFTGL
jgi:hypothetical protein